MFKICIIKKKTVHGFQNPLHQNKVVFFLSFISYNFLKQYPRKFIATYTYLFMITIDVKNEFIYER